MSRHRVVTTIATVLTCLATCAHAQIGFSDEEDSSNEVRTVSLEQPVSLASWEEDTPSEVIEYYDDTGSYLAVPEFELVIDYTPNICETGPMFVASKRFSFDQLRSGIK